MVRQSSLRHSHGQRGSGQTDSLLSLLSLTNALVGFFLYYVPQLSMGVAAFYSIFSAVLALSMAFTIPNRLRSWLFWFTCTYFLFYQFGTIMGTILIGFDASIVDYATNFSNSISYEAVTKSYVASGLGIAIVWSFGIHLNMNNLGEKNHLPFDPRMYQIGVILLLLTLPPLIIDLIDQFTLSSSRGYAFIYTKAFEDQGSIIPAISLIRTINGLAFYMIFASKPLARRFWVASAFFVLIAILDSMKGARSALIVPIFFIVWHAVVYYNLRIRLRRSFVLGVALVLLVIVMTIRRSDSSLTVNLITNFLVRGISTAQHILAVVLDNYQNVDVHSIFALEPVTFPFKYLEYGSAIVGQSETTALLRLGLNHTFSSQLNLGAYLDGAGIGSAFIAEAMQFGPVFMPVFILIWFLFNITYFKLSQKSRLLFLIQPIVFMHLIFSPRDSIFLNTWPVLKVLVIYLVILVAVRFLPKKTRVLQ